MFMTSLTRHCCEIFFFLNWLVPSSLVWHGDCIIYAGYVPPPSVPAASPTRAGLQPLVRAESLRGAFRRDSESTWCLLWLWSARRWRGRILAGARQKFKTVFWPQARWQLDLFALVLLGGEFYSCGLNGKGFWLDLLRRCQTLANNSNITWIYSFSQAAKGSVTK